MPETQLVIPRSSSFYDLYDADGVLTGEKPFGNLPSMTVSISTEEAEHISSESGMAVIDDLWVTQADMAVAFTADDMKQDVVALFLRGDDIATSQSYDDDVSVVLASSTLGQTYLLGKYNVGIQTLKYKEGTAVINVGDVIVGGTGAQTWDVVGKIGNNVSGVLYLVNKTGVTDIIDSEGLEVSGGEKAKADGVVTLANNNVSVSKTDGTVTYQNGVDYEVDNKGGSITILADGAITGTDSLTVAFEAAAAALKTCFPLANEQIFCKLRIVTDNPKGPNRIITLLKVNLKSTGDMTLANTDTTPTTLQFEGKCIKTDYQGTDRFGFAVQVT